MAILDHPGFALAGADLVILSQPETNGTIHRFHLHRSVLQSLLLHESLDHCKDSNEISLNASSRDLELLFAKLYESHDQYKLEAPGIHLLDFAALSCLIWICEQFSLVQHARETKAMLKYELYRGIEPSDTEQFKPLLKSLEVVASLNDSDVSESVANALYEYLGSVHLMPHYPALVKDLDAKNIPSTLWKELLLRCLPLLLASQSDYTKHKSWSSDIARFVHIMSKTVTSDASHELLACWVGVAVPAWELVSIEALAGLWADSTAFNCKSILEQKEKQNEVLSRLRSANYGDCDLCVKAIKYHISVIEDLQNVWLLGEGIGGSDTTDDDYEEASSPDSFVDYEAITNSEAYAFKEGSVAILSKSIEGQQSKYFVDKSVIATSEILAEKDRQASETASATGKTTHSGIQTDLKPEELEALLSVLYSDGLPRRSGESTGHLMYSYRLPLAYVLLEEYKFTDYASEVRGVLRQQLYKSKLEHPHYISDVIELLQYATRKSDVVMGGLALSVLKRTAQTHGFGTSLFDGIASDSLSASSWQTMLVSILQCLVRTRIELDTVQHELSKLWSAVDTLVTPPSVNSDHTPYACWKLKSLPHWKQTIVTCMRMLVPSKCVSKPIASGLNLESCKVALCEQINKVHSDSNCPICKQALADKIKAVANAFEPVALPSSAYVESLKRKRPADDEEGEEGRQQSSTPYSEIV